MANQTVYPYGTGGELPSSIGIINDLTTGGVNKALSAEMGKTLNGNLTQLGQKQENYLVGQYINSTGGIDTDATCAAIKDYIAVTPGDTISIIKPANKFIAFYNANKEFIARSSINAKAGVYSVQTPVNAYYFRVSFVLSEIHNAYVFNYTHNEVIWIPKDSSIGEELVERNLLIRNYIPNSYIYTDLSIVENLSYVLPSKRIPVLEGDVVSWDNTKAYGRFVVYRADGTVLDSWSATGYRSLTMPANASSCNVGILKNSGAEILVNGEVVWKQIDVQNVADTQLSVEILNKKRQSAESNIASINNALQVIDGRVTTVEEQLPSLSAQTKNIDGLLNEDENILFKRIFNSSIVASLYTAISPLIDIHLTRKIRVTNKESRSAYYLGYNEQKEYVDFWSIAAGGGDSRTLPSTVYYIRVTYIIDESCKPVVDNTEVINRDDNSIIWKPILTWFAKDNSSDILDLHPYKDVYPLLANLKNDINPVTVQPYGDKPLSLMFFSDLHACPTPLGRMIKFAKQYASVIDDVVSGGDNVDRGQNSFDFWGDSGAGMVLSVMGNHDDIYISGTAPTIGGVAVKVQSVGWSAKEVYNKQIAPFIDQLSGVTLVTDKCYWYKDYPNSKIRLIGLDDYHWKERITLVDNTHPTTYDDGTSVDTGEQLAWFESVLADAKANELSVMVVHHSPARWDNPIRCSFTSLDFQNNIATDASNPSTIPYIREPFVAVQNFIDGGGKFIGWLTGHLHQDAVGVVKGFPDQFQMTIDTSRYGYNVADVPFSNGFGSTAHYSRTNNADLFDIVSVDTYTKTISLVRIGCNYDRRGRHIGSFVWDYENKQMISCD